MRALARVCVGVYEGALYIQSTTYPKGSASHPIPVLQAATPIREPAASQPPCNTTVLLLRTRRLLVCCRNHPGIAARLLQLLLEMGVSSFLTYDACMMHV